MSDIDKKSFISRFIASKPYLLLFPLVVLTLYFINIIGLGTLNTLLLPFAFATIGIPLLYKHSYSFQRASIFLNFVTVPLQPNFNNPSKCGLKNALNFYLKTDDGILLGVWYIAPEQSPDLSGDTDEGHLRSLLSDGKDIVVYCHGNAGNRSAPHRLELYSVLRRQFHVITFDYRSYGDSTEVPPTEEGLVNDSMFIFKWTRQLATGNVFVWGHSLGSGISTHMLDLASTNNMHPAGLILESPFNNMREEIEMHVIVKFFCFLPWFRYCILEPVAKNKLLFQTDQHINNVNCPILILHAKDDLVVPFPLGLKLYLGAKQNRSKMQGEIQFRQFEESEHYGHKYICRSPDLHEIVRNFVADCNTGNTKY